MRLIDADDLENVVLRLNKEGRTIMRNEYKMLDNIISEFPTIEAEPVRHGRWIDTGSGTECSVCMEIQYGYDSNRNYCPNCGAKMEEAERG